MSTNTSSSLSSEETNINNINYINNTNNFNDFNNTNDFNFCLNETNQKTQVPYAPAGRSALASLSRPADSPPVSQVICEGMPAETIPLNWRGLKIDIFNNRERITLSQDSSIKIKLNIIRQDSSKISLVAAMNSPNRYVWRQVNDAQRQEPHWQTIRQIQQKLKLHEISYRVSKCSKPNREGSTDIVVFLLEDRDDYAVKIVNRNQIYDYILTKNPTLTDRQRKANIVASKFIGQTPRLMTRAEELGL